MINTYKDGKIPLIIAYLHASDQDEINKMESGIRGIYPNLDFIPIIAKRIKSPNGMVNEPSGLIEIKERTIFKFGDTINSMSFVHVQNKAIQLVLNIVDNIKGLKDLNNLETSVCDLYEKQIGKLNENDKNEIKKKVKGMIEYCQEDIDFNDEIDNYIQTFTNKKKNVRDDKNETKSDNFRRTKTHLKPINPELKNIVDRIKKDLESKFNNCIRAPNIKFNEEIIYNYFLKVIKKATKYIYNKV